VYISRLTGAEIVLEGETSGNTLVKPSIIGRRRMVETKGVTEG